MDHAGSESSESGSLPLGFEWGAVRAGIKASGNLDLALAYAPRGASAAAMLTRNQVVAAPLTVGQRHLASTGGRVTAVLVNAGNANCATGESGIRACVETCKATAEALGCIFDEVFPSSTGIIGVPLPAEKLISALPAARASLGSTPEHVELFARAIMTTDTRRKVARATVDVDGKQVRLFGVAKGAGMIAPQLGAPPHATMLVYLFTDLQADAASLERLLAPAVERSFNSISIDGDTSTNDTVLLLASGASGIRLGTSSSGGPETERGPGEMDRVGIAFANALTLVCGSLAHQIVDDGEGVGHVVTLQINGAETEEDARQVARTIAGSALCKTAWSSADPNWGRILCAAGYSGVTFDPARVSIRIAGQSVFESGARSALFSKEAAHQDMLAREYTIELDLGGGGASTTFITCDLTEEYVRINADYST